MAAILAAAMFDFKEIIKAPIPVFGCLTDTLYTPAKSNIIKARGVFVPHGTFYGKQARTLISNPRAFSGPETPMSTCVRPIKTRHIAFYEHVFCGKPFEIA
jgi:hypothetical protein